MEYYKTLQQCKYYKGTCNKMSESQKHCLENECMLYKSIYMKFKNIQN